MYEHEMGYGWCISEKEIKDEMRRRLLEGVPFQGEGYLAEGGVWIRLRGGMYRLYNEGVHAVVPFSVSYIPSKYNPKIMEPGINYLGERLAQEFMNINGYLAERVRS